MLAKFDKIDTSLRLGVQSFYTQTMPLVNPIPMVNIEAFAETSPVEPDAVNTVVGKSLQLLNTLYRPVNRYSLPSCDVPYVIISPLLAL